ncbi:MAG TPA: flagellar hook-basal body complex protein FliE [Clostridiales bacterium]|jgi:flagellar hook-basal body complex protein FliE|nr:flagellar hook-basal body complex protein FliE [Clostridiales bacterium]
MFIEPIKSIDTAQINELNKTKEKNNELSFKSIFDTAIDNYKNAEAEVDKDIYKLSIGETDDLHNLMINTQKAQISLDLVIQLRNKALEAYNEIMRMGV